VQEQKVIYDGSDGQAHALRGRITIEGDWVVVQRMDGHIRIPVRRVFYIEDFEEGRR